MDAVTLSHTIIQLFHHITEEVEDMEQVCFVGVNPQGYVLAERMAEHIYTRERIRIPVCHMTDIDCRQKRKKAVLVTDILTTGEAECIALYAVMNTQLFSTIFLASLVDVYNQRRFPLYANFVGHRMFISEKEEIGIKLGEPGEEDEIWRNRTK